MGLRYDHGRTTDVRATDDGLPSASSVAAYLAVPAANVCAN